LRVPNHIGIIPDGNRRWALEEGLTKDKGYDYGLNPGLEVYKLCMEIGVKELTFYGFTTDNTKRPSVQTQAFTKACVDAVKLLEAHNANLLVIGNKNSPMFPKELEKYTNRRIIGDGGINVNFLVNYGWKWDLTDLYKNDKTSDIDKLIYSSEVPRIDLIIRWGGRRRLSGFLPIQSVYADFYVVDDFWPDYKNKHFYDAIDWYNTQDITMGG